MKIQLEPSEALLALGAIQDKQLTASRLAAISTGKEHEIADMSAKILHRVAQRLTDALYPDECRWMDNEDCRNPIEADGLCGRHLRHRARVAEIMADAGPWKCVTCGGLGAHTVTEGDGGTPHTFRPPVQATA